MFELIQNFDEQMLWRIAETIRTPAINAIMIFYTSLGNAGWVFILIGAVMLFFKKSRLAGESTLCAMLFGLLITNLTLKPMISRARPWIVMENFVSLITSSDMNSFPSGHTCAAFAFAVAVCMTLPYKWGKAAALIAAALMGFSRLYVGVHFPSDVLAGAIIGAVCGWLGSVVVRKIKVYYCSRKAAE